MLERAALVVALAACSSPRAKPTAAPLAAVDVPFTLGDPLPAPVGEPPSLSEAPERLGDLYTITTDTTGHFYFSPDGKYLVYLSNRDGVVRTDPDGGNRLVLYPPGPGYFVFTPDARYVLFPSNSKLVRVPLDGGDAVTLATGLSQHASIKISPDSKWLTYNGIAGPATLIGIDGGPGRIVAEAMPQYGTHVHFTPDAAGVVHWSRHKTFYTPVDGSGFRRLAPNLDTAGLLHPWPSGAAVLGPSGNTWFAPYDGSEATALPLGANLTGMQASAWLRAVPTVGDQRGNMYYVDMSTHVLHQVNRALKPTERMVWGDNTAPGWYVYTTLAGQERKGRSWDVFAIPTGKGEARALARAHDTYTLVARATADGSRVIMHTHTDAGKMTFYQGDLRTGELARITGYFPGWNNFYPSPDSRHIVFAVTKSGTGSSRTQALYTLRLPE